MMVLKLENCSDADMDRTFEIVSNAFGHEHQYIEAAFPAHDTSTGRALGSTRMLSMKKTDPSTTFLKVTDSDTGLMIAQAKWNIYNNTVPEETDLDGNFWENEEEKLYAQLLYREYLTPRRKVIKDLGENMLCIAHLFENLGCFRLSFSALDILIVDPEYQRRGAGRLLVKWGTSIADDIGFMI